MLIISATYWHRVTDHTGAHKFYVEYCLRSNNYKYGRMRDAQIISKKENLNVIGISTNGNYAQKLITKYGGININLPITVAAWTKVWTVFALLEHWVRWFEYHSRHGCLCVGSGFATGWSPVQGVLPAVYRIKKLKKKRPMSKGL
jgi:hypothetical protein